MNSKIGKSFSYVNEFNRISNDMKNFVEELDKQRISEIAMGIQLNGQQEEELSKLSHDRQGKVIEFLSKIKEGRYDKQDLRRMKSWIDAQIGMGENAKELYENLNIDKGNQEILNREEQREKGQRED